MAFNPFNIFRRNQKVIFAIVTVFVMFTFVLSSGLPGAADFFSWLPNWIGSKTQRGTALFEIDGAKYTSPDLDLLRRERLAANQYMRAALDSTLESMRSTINSSLGKVDQQNQTVLTRLFNEARNPQSIPGLQRTRGIAREFANRSDEGVTRVDRDVAREIENYAALMEMRSSSVLASGQQDMYFSIPTRTNRDMAEFLLWRKKADKLGISFGDKEVQDLVVAEFLGKLGQEEPIIRRAVVQDRKITDGKLWAALNDEFRVRMAQESVLGSEVQRPGGPPTRQPTFATPFDLFTTYRDEFSPTSYKMLSIPVSSYIGLVKETPSTADLEKLFNEYKSVEPNPTSDKPGFKEPRKAKIEWISATGTEPYYKTAAEQSYAESGPKAQFGSLFAHVPNIAGVAASLATATTPDISNHNRYMERLIPLESDIQQQYIGRPVNNYMVLDAHREASGNIASAIGALLGSAPLGGYTALQSAAVAFDLNAWERERQARLKVGLPLVLGSLVPYAWYAPGLPQAFEAAKAVPKVAGPQVYAAEFRTRALEKLAHSMLVEDFDKFRTELETKTKDVRDPAKKKQAVDSYIAEFVRTRGLQHGVTADFRDEFNVGEDPAMAPLKAEANREPPRGPLPPVFGKSFYLVPPSESKDGQDLRQQFMILQFMAQQARGNPEQMAQIEAQATQLGARFQRLMQQPDAPLTGLYEPRPYPTPLEPSAVSEPKPTFLVWHTEEQAPRTVTFRVAEPKVLAAWKEGKAREMAKADAERIAAEIKAKNPTNDDQLKTFLSDAEKALESKFPEAKGVNVFTLGGVSPWIQPQNLQDATPQQVVPFQIPASENIPHPSDEMKQKLLDERKQPTGTAFVVADGPKDTYYVAAVDSRFELPELAFSTSVYNAPGSPVDLFVRRRQAENTMKMQDDGVLALLKKEFRYENENTEALSKSGE